MTNPLDRLTLPTTFLDYETEEVQGFIDHAVKDRSADPTANAIDLYYAVRDGIFYEVYGASLSPDGLKASHTVTAKSGFCLHKSVLYAAAVRALGVPSRLVYSDVRNHLASPRLLEHIGGDVFFHGLTEVHLNGKWVKATPVFNQILCKLYGMQTLEFDGVNDSLYHPFNEGGGSMEFVTEHGAFDDVPYDFILETMRRRHPKFLDAGGTDTVRGGRLIDESALSQ